jgi:hypothetical protein
MPWGGSKIPSLVSPSRDRLEKLGRPPIEIAATS